MAPARLGAGRFEPVAGVGQGPPQLSSVVRRTHGTSCRFARSVAPCSLWAASPRRRCQPIAGPSARGYTPGMKTAVSIPDDVFLQAERTAKRLKKSRSELYAEALAEYLAKREPATVTAAIDAVLSEMVEPEDGTFTRAAARKTLGESEW